MAEIPTITAELLPASGNYITAGEDVALQWELDYRANDARFSYWNGNRPLYVSLLKQDGPDYAFDRLIAQISSGTYNMQDANLTWNPDEKPFALTFTLTQIDAGGYKLQIGDKINGWGADADPNRIRFTSDEFDIINSKPLTITFSGDSMQGTVVNIDIDDDGSWLADELVNLYYRPAMPDYELDAGQYPWTKITDEAIEPASVSQYQWPFSPEITEGDCQVGALRDGEDETLLDKYWVSNSITITARAIEFTVPDGTDAFIAGETIDVNWTSEGFSLTDFENDVALYYQSVGNDDKVQLDVFAGETGDHSVTLPNDIVVGSYYLLAVDAYDATVGVSASIAITEKEFYVVSPVPGSRWRINDPGDGHRIKWSYGGYDDSESVTVSYTDNDGLDWFVIASGVPITVQYTDWDASALSAGAYKLKFEIGLDDYYSETFALSGQADYDLIKRRTHLVAVTDNQIYIENDDGNLQSAGIVSGDISPITPAIAVVPAFQKVFVGDGQYDHLYCLDPINAKVRAEYPDVETRFVRGENLTASGGAEYLMDYAIEIGANIYDLHLYKTNGQITAIGETLTTSGKTATVQNDEDNGNHWIEMSAVDGCEYLPTSASIGCLYRGRIVLAGDRSNPHAWYMSRSGNPFDWTYAAGDAASPIAGSNSDVGEVGDVIVALAPYHDDYLLIGCNQSLWLMRGDPAAGGSLDSLTAADGIFGALSWCFDGQNNFYFVGLGGVYMTPSGSFQIINLTSKSLPDFMHGVNRNTHWVTMGYDVRRNGIQINITNITKDNTYGAGSSWWIDLSSGGGFFPDLFPQESAPFGNMYYGSENPDHEQFVMACHDGNIRAFSETVKDDDGIPIESYCYYPPRRIGALGTDGKLNEITVTTGGGDADSDSVTCEVFVGKTAQEVLDSDSPHGSVTVEGVQRTSKRVRARGSFVGLKLSGANETDNSFAIESVSGDVLPGGRTK